MKVICAGFSKTGTKSMNRALTVLGYKVFDYIENIEEHGDNWVKIAKNEAGLDLLKTMFKDIDAGTDLPIYCFWEELLQAFPDAKVILMVRDNEDQFCASMIGQIENNQALIGVLCQILSPSYRKLMEMNKLLAEPGFGYLPEKTFQIGYKINELCLKQAYRRHNAFVQECCPKDRLLVFNCKEGWDPLCKFLNLPVPSEPFPHKNIKGEMAKDIVEMKTFRKIKAEVFLSSISLVLMFGLGSYWSYRKFIRF
ncbi:uncharacterized protein LOC120348015 [Styela clava]